MAISAEEFKRIWEKQDRFALYTAANDNPSRNGSVVRMFMDIPIEEKLDQKNKFGLVTFLYVYYRLVKESNRTSEDVKAIFNGFTCVTDRLAVEILLKVMYKAIKHSTIDIDVDLVFSKFLNHLPNLDLHYTLRILIYLVKLAKVLSTRSKFKHQLLIDNIVRVICYPDIRPSMDKLLRKEGTKLETADLCGFAPLSLVPPLRILIIHSAGMLQLLYINQNVDYTAACDALMKEYELDYFELRPLYHLIFIDDEVSYFAVMKAMLQCRTPVELHPLLFYTDLISDCDWDPARFYTKWLLSNLNAVEFVLNLFKCDHFDSVGKGDGMDFAQLVLFHQELVSVILTTENGNYDTKFILRSISHFIETITEYIQDADECSMECD
jgi:hypothetical protein